MFHKNDHLQLHKASLNKVQSTEHYQSHTDSHRSYYLAETMKLISNKKKSRDLEIKTYCLNNSAPWHGAKESGWSETPNSHEFKQLVKNL